MTVAERSSSQDRSKDDHGRDAETTPELTQFGAALARREELTLRKGLPTTRFATRSTGRWKVIREHLVTNTLLLCGSLSVATTCAIVVILVYESLGFFRHVSLSQFLLDTEWTPLFADNPHFGIWPLVSGTVLTSAIALATAIPLGLIIAIYLSQFAAPKTRSILKPFLEILAGIPTVVYGYFALLVVTPFLQFVATETPGLNRIMPEIGSFNALSPGLVMGLMILPMVASLSEDALYAVPRTLREGAYALGANRLQTIFGVLVPAAYGGISASFILAMSRAIGETMIVAIAAGQQPTLSVNVLQPLQTMTAYIVQISLGDTPHGTIEFQTIFAVAGLLFLMTLILNIISLRLREKYEESFG